MLSGNLGAGLEFAPPPRQLTCRTADEKSAKLMPGSEVSVSERVRAQVCKGRLFLH